jgi:4'-phosphopantetheinyl transferase
MFIKQSEIHLWILPQDDPSFDFSAAGSVLSRDEVARANRYHRTGDASRYVRSRFRLRKLIEGYTGIRAKDIGFSYGAYGKPELSSSMLCRDIRFCVSHARDLTLLAFTVGRDVGVDVESTAMQAGLQDDIPRFLSKKERSALDAASPDLRELWSLRCWTRKEACLKLLGVGVSVGLETIDVSSPPFAFIHSASPPEQHHTVRALWVSDLELDERHVGALALATKMDQANIRYFHDGDD